jgi:hypothetical protein
MNQLTNVAVFDVVTVTDTELREAYWSHKPIMKENVIIKVRPALGEWWLRGGFMTCWRDFGSETLIK